MKYRVASLLKQDWQHPKKWRLIIETDRQTNRKTHIKLHYYSILKCDVNMLKNLVCSDF